MCGDGKKGRPEAGELSSSRYAQPPEEGRAAERLDSNWVALGTLVRDLLSGRSPKAPRGSVRFLH